MKLYTKIDSKNKDSIYGTIYNRPSKNQKEIYLRYKTERLSDYTFMLDIFKVPNPNPIYTALLDETFDCSMTAKDILYYVEQRIEILLKNY